MSGLPPGTVLQLMYLRERLQQLQPGRFIEVGPGAGEITRLLLELGWSGESFDLDPLTIAALQQRFAAEVTGGRYQAVCQDVLSLPEGARQVDLVISCMVMEHMDDASEPRFMRKAASLLRPGGRMIGLVPASPGHWGIEDDIAGHCRRYTREALQGLADATGWQVEHLSGLTYPVSNMLLPLSNHLVRRSEDHKLRLSALERTQLSGRRSVKYKTYLPSFLGLLSNRYTLAPLHWLQKACGGVRSALVLYFEARPADARTAT
jgi:cyclopropane fatty-acyl-phospholipid synthase-like methyltransferase